MKLNARIRNLLNELNCWHCVKEFERQGVKADKVTIYETTYGHRRDQPGVFVVSHRCYDPKPRREGEPLSQQYWKTEFAIRDSLGNPTRIGKMMGIKTRDKRISIFSPKGRAIQEFLHRMAWIEACRLTNDRSTIRDEAASGHSYRQKPAA
jgi:hypothetical protein